MWTNNMMIICGTDRIIITLESEQCEIEADSCSCVLAENETQFVAYIAYPYY